MKHAQTANDRSALDTPPQGPAAGRKGGAGLLPPAPVFVAYHRVSTREQGVSGLGLEAQQRTIAEYVERVGGSIFASFTEIESGRNADRPEFRKAAALARRKRATLIVAKLDRLARSVAFISALMEANVDFVIATLPSANRLTIHILAAVAEWEAKEISARTKAGLESRRLRGFKLGTLKNLRPGASPAPELNKARARQEAERMRPIIDQLTREGITSIRGVLNALNDRGYTTGRGMGFHLSTVRRLLKRLGRTSNGNQPGPATAPASAAPA